MTKMLQKISVLLIALTISMPLAFAGGGENTSDGSISVTGRTRMEITNPQFTTTQGTISVITSGLGFKTFAEASAKDSAVYESIKAELTSMNLDFKLESSWFGNSPAYDENNAITDYNVSHDYSLTIQGKTDSMKLFEAVNALSDEHTTVVLGSTWISFPYEPTVVEEALTDAQLDGLYAKAYASAVRKAQKIAKLSNTKIGKATNVSESMYITDINNKQNVIFELYVNFELIKK